MSALVRMLSNRRRPTNVSLQIPATLTEDSTAVKNASLREGEKQSCSLMVVGTENVGKTALVVRFLAKRFLPQYAGDADKTYCRTVNVEEKKLDLKVIDKIGKGLMTKVTSLEGLNEVDGLIVVFSCSDSESFNCCLDLLDYFKFDCKSTLNTPILVIGNKIDLNHMRKVGSKEAEKCVLKYPGCSFEECSAASQDDNVEVVFRSFIKKIIAESDTRELQKNGRKTSIGAMGSPKVIRAHFKRRFSMFGRDRNGST
ncbi:ras-related and estrogen-regulated growth inhibitor-like protein [Watersipora subatra]|uniref:ras-related and estrogen-regulated growth inhibitor-like protein n=1 Tax=Watersipora subatra TaxID=2589382 RepID=UPI00355B6A47